MQFIFSDLARKRISKGENRLWAGPSEQVSRNTGKQINTSGQRGCTGESKHAGDQGEKGLGREGAG